MDRWNYDPQDRASIAASRGKNKVITVKVVLKEIKQFSFTW